MEGVVVVVVVVEVVRGGPCGGGGGDGGISGGGGGGCGGLNSFDQPRHPEIPHGVLELLAVDITFELLGVLLDTGPPIVFDLIVSPSWQVLCNF